MSSPSRKRILQDLALQSNKNNHSNFPTLFNLAIQTCISQLHIFATFEGLPYYPFGQALFTEFVKRSNQWRITTEQRQVGIFLFAESYGDEFLGPEYTGLRCSLVQDVPYLNSFGDCLVYLDLSGGCGGNSSTGDGGLSGFTDKDISGLSALSCLRILNLSQLKIGDIGLSHLIRSVTYGSSGPTMLEYLNLSGTEVTDVGLSKIFDKKNQKSPVFVRLLGIDLTDSKVHEEVAEVLFRNHAVPWKRLENRTSLFPDLPSNKAAKDGHSDSYVESGSGSNPMQKWIDCFSERSFKIKFGQRPDLSLTGNDAWGLSECLALAKLGQVYFHPLSEPTSSYQQEFSMNLSAAVGKKSQSRRSRYVRDFEDMLLKAVTIKETQSRQQQSDLEHMYNLKMYQNVLGSIRETAGSLVLSKSKKTTALGATKSLAFVRSRTDVEDLLASLDFCNDSIGSLLDTHEEIKKAAPVTSNTDNTVKAKVRDRRLRVAASSISAVRTPSPQTLMDKSDQRPVPLSGPFPKRLKASISSPFIKQESSTPSFANLSSSSSHDLESRRIFGAHSKYHPPPFVKPAAEQTTSSIFITKAGDKDEITSTPVKLQSPILHANKKSRLSSATMMERWVSKAKQPSSDPTSSSSNNTSVLQDKGQSFNTSSTSGCGSIIREFHFADENDDTVNLDRWIRSGPVVRGIKSGNNMNEFGRSRGDGHTRNVIRFDPKNELFADRDTDVDHQQNG
ncbi:hypothetical protein BGX26_002472 [Mortierella sp. AD094]|nr:hypothetical protein BGX26_002472 [Mortierella sp. AD094]